MKSLLTTLLLITGISIAQPPPGNFLPPSYPQTISFQAMMTDTLGNPVADGTHNFRFRISSPAQGGAEIFWEETKQVDVVDGVVSTILGSVTPIDSLPFSDDLRLNVALDNELISVNTLTSVPFALMSSRAMRAYNATHADTALFSHHSQHSEHADTSNFTHHAMHADTAHFVMNVPMSDTSHFAHQAGHAEHADTSNFTHQANHSEHADTAGYANSAGIALSAITADTANYANNAHTIEFPDTVIFNNTITYPYGDNWINSDWMELDLSSIIGNRKAFIVLEIYSSTGNSTHAIFRAKSDDTTLLTYEIANSTGTNIFKQTFVPNSGVFIHPIVSLVTDNNGIIEWEARVSNENPTWTIKLLCYQY